MIWQIPWDIQNLILEALFRKVSNVSPVQFLQHLRIETAQRLIRERRLSLTEIAFEVGFNSSQYFSNCFKKQVGLESREYRTALNKTNKKKKLFMTNDHNSGHGHALPVKN